MLCQKMRSNSGFTLIEVMIVIMIVGLLITTSTPLLATTLRKARTAEAKAGLGAVRRSMRMHYVEYRTYKDPQFRSGRMVTFGRILPLGEEDLNGRYFSAECYRFERVKRRTFRVVCDGSLSEAPGADDVRDVLLYTNQQGDIWLAAPEVPETPLEIAISILGRD